VLALKRLLDSIGLLYSTLKKLLDYQLRVLRKVHELSVLQGVQE
jgi:hypothetical protein